MRERATELEYLRWCWQSADFGPADGDVRDEMAEKFMAETGKSLPEGWNFYQDGDNTDEFWLEAGALSEPVEGEAP